MALTPRTSTPNPVYVVVRAVVWAATAMVMLRTSTDPDLWGHVRFGGDILRDGLHVVDRYSFTSDIPWINHEWLAEVLMWIAWELGGGAGLIALKMMVIGGTTAIAWQLLGRAGVPLAGRDLLVLVLVFAIWPRTAVVRPQLFSVLLFAGLMWSIQSSERGEGRRLLFVPLIFMVWVNLHGGWIVGLGMFGGWLALTMLSGQRPLPVAMMLGVAASCTLALLVNPHGWQMLRFVAETVRIDRSGITDWIPTWRAGVLLGLWGASTAVAAGVAVRRWRTIPIADAAVVAVLAIASLRVSRLDAFYALAVTMLLGPRLGSLGGSAQRIPRTWSAAALMVAALTVVAIRMPPNAKPLSCVSMDVPWAPDLQADAFIRGQALKGRMITWFNWGEYALWHYGPDLKVSMDGRRETVYSQAFIDAHLALYQEPEQNLDLLRRLDAGYAWLPLDLPLVRALERHGWTTVFSGARSAVLARAPFATREPVAAPSATGCFPGP